jgi:diguanylate cyclase
LIAAVSTPPREPDAPSFPPDSPRLLSPTAKLGSLILTDNPRQQIRIKRLLIAGVMYVLCIGLLAYTVYVGYAKLNHALVLLAGVLISNAIFFLLLRSGWNKRWADPALTLPQVLVAQTWIACGYAVIGTPHAGTLPLLALVLVFGMFNLSARETRIASVYTIVVMGVVIAYKTITEPDVYVSKAEWVYFFFVVTIMPMISLLALQHTGLRERLRAQKRDLETKNAALEAAFLRIEQMVTQDEMTGLANRRHMVRVVAEHAQRHARLGHKFCLVMLDLDGFKSINDTYGHGVGDNVIRSFAREATKAMRETDVISRWGGEEFLILLSESPPHDSSIGLGRLRSALANAVVCNSTPQLRIQFSAGITEYRPLETIEQTIERADKALYKAKASGRNCTVLA